MTTHTDRLTDRLTYLERRERKLRRLCSALRALLERQAPDDVFAEHVADLLRLFVDTDTDDGQSEIYQP